MWVKKDGCFAMEQKLVVSAPETESFCVQFDPDNKYFAVGGSDGTVRLYNTLTGKCAAVMSPSRAEHMPVTCVKYGGDAIRS